MGALFSYSLGASVFMLFGYLAYKLFLSGEKQPGLNRCALIAVYLVSLTAIPLLSMEWGRGVSQPVTGQIDLGGIMVSVAPTEPTEETMNLPRVLLALYLAGIAVSGCLTAGGLMRVAMLLRRGTHERRGQYTLVTLPECDVPFSFGRYIIIGEGEQSNFAMVEAHELAHLRFRHWLDLLLAQGVCILLWYNPVAWLMRGSLRQVHEYQADAEVLARGFNPYDYQMLLIKKAAGRRLQSLANSLNHSNLKKRITMMYKSENRGLRSMRALALLPAIVLAAFAVEQPAIATTIGQAGSASLLPVSAVEETVVAGKVNENFSDCQLPDDGATAMEQPSEGKSGVAAAAEVMPQADSEAEEEVYTALKQMPQFPGGDRAIMMFIMEHLQYPADAMEAGDEGHVVVRFVVGADGAVRDASIVRGQTESLNAEALRVVSSLPAFTPGKNAKGEPVAVYYTVPVTFKLMKDEPKAKVVEHYTGNLTIHSDGNGPRPACFVNGEPFDGDLKDIPSESIAEITIIKNDPAYPDGKMNITLKDS